MALERESETLQNITDYFVPLMRHFRIFFFWEMERTNLKLLRPDYIVTVDSAAPIYDDTERAGIAADHSGMVKFEEASSIGFQIVADALVRYCQDAPGAIARRLAETEAVLAVERKREALEMATRYSVPGGTTAAPSPGVPSQPIPQVTARTSRSGGQTAVDTPLDNRSKTFWGYMRFFGGRRPPKLGGSR